MQNLNTLFNLVKQAAPVARGSQEHQDLVGQLNNGQITLELFDNSMQGYTPITRGSQQHLDLVGKLNNSEITQGQFNGAMQGRPITPIGRGSLEHQDLAGRLNDGQINQDLFNSAMLGGRKLKERNFNSGTPTLKQKTNGTIPAWYLPITLDPYASSQRWLLDRVPGFWEDYENKLKDKYKLNPLGPGLWLPNKPSIWSNPLGNDKENQKPDQWNPWGIDMDLYRYSDEFWNWYNKDKGYWTKYRPGTAPLWEYGIWKEHKDEFMKWKEDQSKPVTPGNQLQQLNPWERNKDLERYYDEFWKWYNKEGLWTYKPGSDPSWEDETWRRHKDKFMDYYNQQPKPVTPGSPEHLKLVDQLNKGEITKDLFNELMNGKPQATPQPATQTSPLVTPLPAATPAPQPAAPQPSTPSVGSAIGKSTYNPASITRKDMNKYRKYTSARNMNSDMDRWKTWQAMNGNRNASNADYRAAKRNNFM